LPVTRPGRENETVVYRADIDGLRAVSILLVVGYHADFGLVRGGSIGVDVFFVISGFLISRIILTQIKTRTFSSAEFLCAPDSADIFRRSSLCWPLPIRSAACSGLKSDIASGPKSAISRHRSVSGPSLLYPYKAETLPAPKLSFENLNNFLRRCSVIAFAMLGQLSMLLRRP
jgi:Acyltransferase family